MKTGRFSVLSLVVLAAGSFGCPNPAEKSDPGLVIGQETTPDPNGRAETADPETQLGAIKTRLQAVKAQLFEEGRYNCCIQPPCDWCALHEGSCTCLSNLIAGEAVCPGCGLGWHNGQGVVEGIDASDVEWSITHEHETAGHQH